MGNAVDILINARADVNQASEIGLTALESSCDKYDAHIEVVKLLIKAGANVNSDKSGCSPLTRSSSRGHVEIMECLIQAGANVRDNPNLLLLSCNKGRLQPVETLLKAGVDANACASDTEMTALSNCKRWQHCGCTDPSWSNSLRDLWDYRCVDDSMCPSYRNKCKGREGSLVMMEFLPLVS